MAANQQEAEWLKYTPFWPDPDNPDHHGKGNPSWKYGEGSCKLKSGNWEVSVSTCNEGGLAGVGSSSPSGSGGSESKLQKAYTALQAWKSAISNDPLGILGSWVGSNVCNYKGVFCSPSQDFTSTESEAVVAGIDLNHANLQGILVKELSLLTDLSLLHLNTNRFSGTIPETLRDLTSLTELDLSNNQFSGPFPTTALFIPNLLYLDLRFNAFSGPIPDELFNKNLDAIFLNNNQFSGELPQNLGNSPASVINLANNKFSGEIPFSLRYMGSRAKEILFLNNQLTGCIPEGIGMWADLQVLDVSYNSLMGHLPDSISCLGDIEVLNLAHNKLTGELADLVCSLRSLVNLTLAYNFFSGLSQECNQLSLRNVGFDFSLNCIPGKQMQRPQPDCSIVPGGSLSCLRIPAVKPIVCGTLLGDQETSNQTPPSH
nr:leucine-rich repeat extensin-like protein 4 [Ipomoea batatas]